MQELPPFFYVINHNGIILRSGALPTLNLSNTHIFWATVHTNYPLYYINHTHGAIRQLLGIALTYSQPHTHTAQHLPSACTTETIRSSLCGMLLALSNKDLTILQQHFHKTTDSMLARDVTSFSIVSDLLHDAIENQGSLSTDTTGAPGIPDEYRLLGDLPDPTRVQKSRDDEPESGNDLQPVLMDDVLVRPKVESEAQQYVQAEGDAPARFRCSLNGHLMKQPVRSPHGHVFERESIEKWIDQAGCTCPFTGKPLQLSDLEADVKLAHEITSWHIKEQAQENEEDELALYDF